MAVQATEKGCGILCCKKRDEEGMRRLSRRSEEDLQLIVNFV